MVILLVRNSEHPHFFATLRVPLPSTNEPKVGVRLSVQKVISRATSTITATAGSNGSVSLSPARPLPATALIITSYYLGGPIIDSWAVGKRAVLLFQVRWNFIGALSTSQIHGRGRKCLNDKDYLEKEFWSRSPSSIWSMWRREALFALAAPADAQKASSLDDGKRRTALSSDVPGR